MKLVLTRAGGVRRSASALLLISFGLFFAMIPCAAQQSPSTATPDPSQEPHGKVIFSRSTDENGDTTTTVGPAAAQPGGQAVSAPTASDEERRAITFTGYDMDVHLRSTEHSIAVRAQVTVRNDSSAPLHHTPLQISSTLAWERIRIGGKDEAFTVATLNSDVDHTGQLHEAAITLATPLAPGASLSLDVTYSGAVAQSAQRLTAIGTPDEMALHSDWDEIGVDFTGLRGFGVVWYPTAGEPVILGDGARVFNEMGEHMLRTSGAHFRVRLAEEFPHGHAPNVCVINGKLAALSVTDAETEGAEVAGVATAQIDETLGFAAPSLFLATRTAKQAENAQIFTRPEDEGATEDWAASSAAVTPFLREWLGAKPRSTLAILDLPDAEDEPFASGALLATGIRQATPEQLDGTLAHALTQAWLTSPRAWLTEGAATFMGTLWIERESGRQKALEALESGRTALALAEPVSPGEGAGQPLSQATAPVYYRTKAAYVFWMLRDLVGDAALATALKTYDPAADAASGLGANAGPGTFEKVLEKTGIQRDLKWFFDDWVNNDKGLPDLAINTVYVAQAQTGNWLATINLSNSGYAGAEVPVTLRSTETSVTERVLIPGRGKAVQRILIHGRPTAVQANDGTVPEAEASVHIKTLSDEPASNSR